MAEKTLPWWRKALTLALKGIRAGLGLLSRAGRPGGADEENGDPAPETEKSTETTERELTEQPTQSELTPEPAAKAAEQPAAAPASEPVAAAPIAPESLSAPPVELEQSPVPIAASERELAPEPVAAAAEEPMVAPVEGPMEAPPALVTEPVAEVIGEPVAAPVAEPVEIAPAPEEHAAASIELEPVPTPEPIEVIMEAPAAAPAAEPPEAAPVPEEMVPASTEMEPLFTSPVGLEQLPAPVAALERELASEPVAEAAEELMVAPVEGPTEAPPALVTEPVAEVIGEPVVAPVAEPVEIAPAPEEHAAASIEPEPVPAPVPVAAPEAEAVSESIAASITGPEPESTLGPIAEPVVEVVAEPIESTLEATPELVAAASAAPAPPPVLDEKAAARLAAQKKKIAEADEQSPFSVLVGQVYEGPLDLLLDLIRKQDIDIYDIPIAQITAQFLAYVDRLKASDVDVAGEFIYTASLLIHIKSKMLLPRTPAGPDETPEDPRRELVERLLEHERFKNAAQMLQQKQLLEAASWTHSGAREFKDDDSAEPEIAADTVDLVRIFRDILERARKRPMIDMTEDQVTVGQMIRFLARRLTMEDKPVALRRLLSHTRSERALIAMFLALLELVRLQAILLRQDRHFSEIFIKKHTGFETAMNEGLANAGDEWR